jgi:selenocysteine lyase/cysteine desulfurase
MDKRSFLKNLGMLPIAGVPLWQSLDSLIKQTGNVPAEVLAKDEDFWEAIRGGYKLKPDYINLENGYYCFLPQEILEKQIDHIREVNYQGSYYMRTVQWDNKKKMAAKLAELAGCSPEELVITRNTTESLDLVIGGTHWREGDEAVMAEQDYGSMLNMFKLMEKKHGVVNKIISVPNHPASDDEIVNLYANAITSKTRLLMVCHMINITGQILPVRKICDMAHSKGVEVLVDGAHAFAHLNFSISDLNCDYYGASLHKWLSVPLGAGILYVKKGNASHVWPLLASGVTDQNDIGWLNQIGTHPVHTDLTIADSIDFYLKIGRDRKESRLRYLQSYWTSKVRNLPHIEVNTPADPARHCGIGNVGVKGMKPQVLADTLLKNYKIYTVAIDGAGVHGCRITPNLYTTTKELDTFVDALKKLG